MVNKGTHNRNAEHKADTEDGEQDDYDSILRFLLHIILRPSKIEQTDTGNK